MSKLKSLSRRIIHGVSLFAMCLLLMAVSTAKTKAAEEKTLLIVNSYHEDELWGNDVTSQLVPHIIHINDLDYDIVYLNNSNVADSLQYKEMSDNVFARYTDKKPDGIVLIGNFAFNLRDRIKQEWGEVPMLLISRSEGFGPLSDYFADYDPTAPIENRTPLASVRDDYNFTAIIVPDYCKQTIDMMMELIPDMKEFVFLSDLTYVNRIASYRIYNYLLEEYPTVNYKWVMASEESAKEFREYMVTRNPKLGLLMSSWCYATTSTRDFPVLTVKDLNMIRSSVNPVFSLHRAYMSYDVIGGIYTEDTNIQQSIVNIVDSMMAGKSMRDIPFYVPQKYTPVINYVKLKEFDLKESKCPKGTLFIHKPESIWERYGMIIVVFSICIILLFMLLWKQNAEQRKRIGILNRLSHFIKGMPIPYTLVEVTIKDGKELIGVKYGDKNDALNKLIHYNKLNENIMQKLPSNIVLEKALELAKNGNSINFKYHFEQSDNYYDILLQLVEVNDKGNGIKNISYDVFIRDITISERAQQEMGRAATLMNMAMDITKLVPWQMDLKTFTLQIDSYNIKGNEIDEETRSVEHLNEYQSRMHPDDRSILDNTILKITKREIKEFMIQYRVVNPEDNTKYDWVENRGAVTSCDDAGFPTKLTGAVQFITARKEHETQMAEALIKANESDRMKSAFLANMSHEIRTPLNAIVGFSSMMVKTKDEKERAQLSQVINKNNDLLLNLINDVLDLAKIESNTIEIDQSICDVNDLLESIGKTMSIRIPKGVLLNIVHYAEKCVVETDASRLAQIIINLLTNACKCTKKGSITLGYEIQEPEDMLYFYVKDTGIGIAKDNQAKIFQQFVKLDSFAQGTGLGLAICRSLVERMGGEIGVESAGEGRGSKFWFTLPYHPVSLDEIEEEETKAEEVHEQLPTVDFSVISERYDNKRMTILVAEDNDSNYWLVEHMLGENYNMLHANNGQEAVEMFQECNPDIIIMDINMPEMDGYQAVEAIRKISHTVPIIAVTAYAFASDRIRILNSGFNAYVSKPISEISMFEAINSVLRDKPAE